MKIYGHGIDLVNVDRIQHSLERHADAFISKLFTPAEIEYCSSSPKLAAQRYAARFAAKEAVFKALGTGWRYGMAWTEIEVQRDGEGKPFLNLTGEVLKQCEQRGIKTWHLSLSHTKTQAMASAIACLDE